MMDVRPNSVISRRRFLRYLAAGTALAPSFLQAGKPRPDRDRVWELARRGIESHRKGTFTLELQRPNSAHVAETPVEVSLKQHAFPFGMIFRPRHYEDDWYRERVLELFNFVELLEFNWGQYEPDEGHPLKEPRQRFMREWCIPHGIRRFYGHMLVWSTQYGEYPKTNLPLWLFKYPPEKQWELLKQRIRRELQDYAEFDMIWDVVNEACHVRPWGRWDLKPYRVAPMEQVVPYVAEVLNVAHEANPDARLLINEYGVLTPGQWRDRATELLQQLQQRTAPLRMFGIQAHEPYKGRYWHAPEDVWQTFEHFGRRFGLPLLITEYWYVSTPGEPIRGSYKTGNWNPERQAEAVEEFFRLAFGSPHVAGIVYFGLADDDVVFPDLGLFDARRNPKPVWERLKQLVHHEWTTKASLRTDRAGRITFRGFFGRYAARVRTDPRPRTIEFEFSPDGPREQTVIVD